MIKDTIHSAIVAKIEKISKWYDQRLTGLKVPFYSSFDIRDSGYKVATVDANIFPAGFNNICQVDQESAGAIVESYLKQRHPGVKKVLLLTEANTKNLYYWDNVATLNEILTDSGCQVATAIPIEDFDQQQIESASGKTIEVRSFTQASEDSIDLVISNNDFTEELAEWVGKVATPFDPSHELGWYRRRKHDYFIHYNQLVSEFADILELPESHFTIATERYLEFDVSSDESKVKLSAVVDGILEELRGEYAKADFQATPYVFLKNASGTYGLGVLPVKSGQEVLELSYKSRKKMKATKGGGGVDEIIVQEGIPSVISFEDGMAEPVIYMVGHDLVGGFLRTHRKKGATESLNSPGAVYERLCVSDLKIKRSDCPLENVYGWLAKIGAVAIGFETRALGMG